MVDVFNMSSIMSEITEVSGRIRKEFRNKHGEYHNDNGPAITFYEPDGVGLIRMDYYFNGVLHRLDGPARIVFDENNNVIRHEYYFCGIKFNGNSPSVIWFDKDGRVSCEERYVNGKLNDHENAFAVVEFNGDKILYTESWENGHKISRTEY